MYGSRVTRSTSIEPRCRYTHLFCACSAWRQLHRFTTVNCIVLSRADSKTYFGRGNMHAHRRHADPLGKRLLQVLQSVCDSTNRFAASSSAPSCVANCYSRFSADMRCCFLLRKTAESCITENNVSYRQKKTWIATHEGVEDDIQQTTWRLTNLHKEALNAQTFYDTPCPALVIFHFTNLCPRRDPDYHRNLIDCC